MADSIVLLGGSGLLGTALLEAYRTHGFAVVAPRRSEVDLTDYNAARELLSRTKPAVLVNAAAIIDVSKIERDPTPAWKINAFSAGALAWFLGECSPKTHYVHLSTNYVFGGTEKGTYREDDTLSPINLYGRTKAYGERLAAAYCRRKAVRYSVVRTSWLFGKTRETFVDEVARALRTGADFAAADDQYGNPTSVVDLAEALVPLSAEAQEGGIYHVVNDVRSDRRGVSRYEIALKVAEILGCASEKIRRTTSDQIFAAKRPSAILLNTKLPPLREWQDALGEHLRGTR